MVRPIEPGRYDQPAREARVGGGGPVEAPAGSSGWSHGPAAQARARRRMRRLAQTGLVTTVVSQPVAEVVTDAVASGLPPADGAIERGSGAVKRWAERLFSFEWLRDLGRQPAWVAKAKTRWDP